MEYNLLLIGLSIFFSAIFSGMEIAFVSANRLRLELDRKQGKLSSRIIEIFTRNSGQYIATMLVGNNIALVVYGIQMSRLTFYLLTILVSPALLLEYPILVLFVQTLVSTGIILVTAEFIPKSLFRMHPNGFLRLFSLPMLLFYIVFYPISKLSIWMSLGLIKRVLRREVTLGEEKKIFGRVDLNHLVWEASNTEATQEVPHEQEIRIFQNALDFTNVKLRDCMIPRPDMEAVEVHTSIEELRERFVETNYSRIPVFQDNIDNIIGYVNCKDLFKRPQSIKSKLLKLEFVPETMLASKLLTSFIKSHMSIAVVVDEFGGTAGLVTIEDIIEEIFGEIDDEHDMSEFVEKQLNDKDFILSGRLEVDYLNSTYKLEIPESDEYDTLAGFVINYHQNIPKPNEVIIIDRFQIKIAKMDGTRIDLVYLSKLKERNNKNTN